jgi:hypothetical protein
MWLCRGNIRVHETPFNGPPECLVPQIARQIQVIARPGSKYWFLIEQILLHELPKGWKPSPPRHLIRPDQIKTSTFPLNRPLLFAKEYLTLVESNQSFREADKYLEKIRSVIEREIVTWHKIEAQPVKTSSKLTFFYRRMAKWFSKTKKVRYIYWNADTKETEDFDPRDVCQSEVILITKLVSLIRSKFPDVLKLDLKRDEEEKLQSVLSALTTISLSMKAFASKQLIWNSERREEVGLLAVSREKERMLSLHEKATKLQRLLRKTFYAYKMKKILKLIRMRIRVRQSQHKDQITKHLIIDELEQQGERLRDQRVERRSLFESAKLQEDLKALREKFG